MLENAWVIPALPVLSFFLILFFGKRLPRGGHEIGVSAVALAFVLASVCAVQWVQRPADLDVHGVVEEHSSAVTSVQEHGPAEEPGGAHEAPHDDPKAGEHEPTADEHEKEGGGHEEEGAEHEA